MNPVAQVLRAAAERIERDGWFQGGNGSDGRRCCIMRALAAETDKARSMNEADGLWRSAKHALEQRVRPPGGLMSTWNDARERTVDDVLAALRGAADDLEARHV